MSSVRNLMLTRSMNAFPRLKLPFSVTYILSLVPNSLFISTTSYCIGSMRFCLFNLANKTTEVKEKSIELASKNCLCEYFLCFCQKIKIVYFMLIVSISSIERSLSLRKNLLADLLDISVYSKLIFNSLSLESLLSPSDIMSMLFIVINLFSLCRQK